MQTLSSVTTDSPLQIQHASRYALNSCTDLRRPQAGWQKDGAGALEISQACVPAPLFLKDRQHHPKALQISADSSLASSRKALLQKAGFCVHTTSIVEAEANRTASNLAVLLFCHTVDVEQAFSLFQKYRALERPPKTVRLTRRPGVATGCYDLVLQAPVAPAVFVAQLRKLHAEFQVL